MDAPPHGAFLPKTHLRQEPVPFAASAAVLVIDMQNYCSHPAGGRWRGSRGDGGGGGSGASNPSPQPGAGGALPTDPPGGAYYWRRLASVVANISSLQAAARAVGVEVVFTVMASLTTDGRERSLDYKLSGFHIPAGSWDARVLEAVAPVGDEIVLSKGSCSVYVSTVASYLLQNMGITHLLVVGGLTEQCVESAVRDFCDAGFLVTLVEDAVVTTSAAKQAASVAAVGGFCRIRDTASVVAEVSALRPWRRVPEPTRAPWASRAMRVAPPQGGTTTPPPPPPQSRLPPPAGVATSYPLPRAVAPPRHTVALSKPFSLPPAPLPPALPPSAAYVRFEVYDINGIGRGKTIPARHAGRPVALFLGATAVTAASSLAFPPEVGAAGYPNTALLPDWATTTLLPWLPGPPVARVVCEQAGADGGLLQSLPRTVLRAQLDALAEAVAPLLGAPPRDDGGSGPVGGSGDGGCGSDPAPPVRVLAAFEYEFTLCRVVHDACGDGCGGLPTTCGRLVPAYTGIDVFASAQTALSAAFTADLDAAASAIGLDVLTINAEYAPAQVEVTIAPHWGVAAADAAAAFKGAVKEVAATHGLAATFMTRPFPDGGGAACGGHLNLSLWAGEDGSGGGAVNLLDGPALPARLSSLGRHFLAGILEHAPGMAALVSPTINCYTGRGEMDGWAPVTACWGVDNRSACVRVKPPPPPPPTLPPCYGAAAACATGVASSSPSPSSEATAATTAAGAAPPPSSPPPIGGGTFIECRQPSAAASPHVALAAVIAAGTDGIRRRLGGGLPPPITGTASAAVRATEAAGGGVAVAVGHRLPGDLPAALAAFAADRRLADALGEPFGRCFRAVKAVELHDWESARGEGGVGNGGRVGNMGWGWGGGGAGGREGKVDDAELARRLYAKLL